MYNVLLVDDEELDLRGMHQFIPWSKLGMVVKGTVNNALSACDIIKNESIDILVSDINMPYMSGLELAKIAQERSPNIRIIFVSGYQEFSYVQQALSLKAYSYVLKPMDDNELITSLLKIKQDLDEEIKQKEVEEAYQSLIPIAKNEMLTRLLEGDMNGDYEALSQFTDSQDFHKLRWPLRAAVLEMDSLAWSRKERTEHELPITQQKLRRVFLQQATEAMKLCGHHFYCKLNAQRVAVLLEERDLDNTVKQLYTLLQEPVNTSITIGLGQPVMQLELMPESYQQAIEAIESKMFLGRGAVIKFEEVSSEPEMLDVRKMEAGIASLLTAMTEYRLVEIYDELEKLFQLISTMRSRFTVHHLTNHFIGKLEQHLNSLGEDLFDLINMDIKQMDILLQFETVQEIRIWLMHRIYEISEQLNAKNNNQSSRFIRNVRSVIKQKMHENITLKDIAQVFSFSPSYLGFLIKEKSGCTFNELLVNMRMERACELLKEPGLKIYEIADQVGYRYLPYFSRQFKDRFGVTPLEYRKKMT